MFRPSYFALLPLIPLTSATTYPLIESWTGSGFLDGFTYDASTYDNTTNGDVFWATAQNTSLIYTSTAGTTILKVDNTTVVPYNDKRYAPKLLSKTAYEPGTVWIMDAVHLPYGCSVWPAFWTQGADWPAGGEIDIMEGVNLQTTNQVALHTESDNCTAQASSTISGTITATNCSIEANSDSGCTTTTTDTSSYGAGFAAAGGGVYAAEFATDGIRVWFFSRSSIPTSITSSAQSIDTSTFGTPVAEYSSTGCAISQAFTAQYLTIDITLCGDWAGVASLLEETCPTLTGDLTCYTTYVINDGSTTYANAYFEINYINVFSSSTSGSSSSSTSTSSGVSGSNAATTTVTGGAGSTSGATSSTGAAPRLHQWQSKSLIGVLVTVIGVLGGSSFVL